MANETVSLMMQMTFYNDYAVTILFETWNVTTVGEYVFACIATFVVTLLWEALRQKAASIEALIDRLMEKRQPAEDGLSLSVEDSLGYVLQEGTQAQISSTSTFSVRCLRTLVHIVRFTLSYFLMLIAMTFNTGLFLCIILGSGAGFFIFSDAPSPGDPLVRPATGGSTGCH
eukprot:m.37455 g.37455  ORF g.37455 m.37455 type:complete len:172 (-) comp5446_c0_seq2:2170-2685(-)